VKSWKRPIALLAALPVLLGDASSFAQAADTDPQGQAASVPTGDAAKAQNAERKPQLIGYKATARRQLFLHVFAPDTDDFPAPRPAIIFFHGGGWAEGDALRFYDQARHLAGRGVVAISADYRTGQTDGTEPRTALSDAISAMRYVRAHAAAFDIDAVRIAAGGGSAGGQLAAALATSNGFEDPADEPSVSYRPAALVLFNPVVDNGPDGFGFDRVSGYWKAFSPLHNVRPGHAPTLIMLGTRDALIPVATGQAYCDKVREAGSACRLELYQGQPHAFFSRARSALYFGKTLAAMDAFLSELGYLGTGAD
jgi:acetyl esterase/lipase